MENANFNFKAAAQEATSLSPVMEGKDKKKSREVAAAFPDGITIIRFDMVEISDKKTGEKKVRSVCNIKENEGIFFFAPTVLEKVIVSWVNGFGGDVKAASDALEAEGGCPMILRSGETREGNPLVTVTII